MEKIKVGIIGCGAVSRKRHIPSYLRNKNCQIEAICSPNLNDLNYISKKYNIKKTYTNLDSLLSQKLDLVSICTPPFTHYMIAKKCLENGCNVLVEKPMAMNSEEAEDLIKLSQKMNVKLCVSHNFLFSNSMLEYKRLIKNDLIGEIRGIWFLQLSNFKRGFPQWYSKLPGGLIFDESPHMLYLMNFLMPDLNVDSVITSEDVVFDQRPRKMEVYLKSKKTETCLISMDFGCSREEWFLYIVSDRAMVKIDLFKDTMIYYGKTGYHNPLDVLYESLNEISQNINQLILSGFRLVTKKQLYGHDKLINQFVSSIILNEDSPVNVKDMLDVVKMQEQIFLKANIVN